MKKIMLLSLLLLAVYSCKNEKETTDTVEEVSEQIAPNTDKVVENENTDPQKVETTTSNTQAVNSVQQDLVAFDGLAALQFLKLEDLKPGMDEVDLKEMNIKANQNMESAVRRTGEGDFSVYQIEIGGVPMVEIYPVAGQVMDVALLSEYATPPKMIGIGNTYAELLSVYPDAKAMGSEIEARVTVQVGTTVFLLDTNYSKSEAFDAPLNSKIKWISFR